MSNAKILLGGKFGINWQDSISPNGHNLAEVRSAVIKELRRGLEEEALCWALELHESGPQIAREFWDDLRVFTQEDIGPAYPEVLSGLEAQMRLYFSLPGDDQRRRVVIAGAICTLARLPKSRYATELLHDITYRRADGSMTLKIPDYALDIHVRRGKTMGRGHMHYITVGAHLENQDKGFPDTYRKRILKRTPEDKNK